MEVEAVSQAVHKLGCLAQHTSQGMPLELLGQIQAGTQSGRCDQPVHRPFLHAGATKAVWDLVLDS